VSAKVWKKYNMAKSRRFAVDLTVDNEPANKKLQTLDKVGMVDQYLDKPFWPPFFLHAR
jgi:hypothetical protein